MTKAQDTVNTNYHYMAEAMRRLEQALHGRMGESGMIPPEWHEIAQSGGARPKVKLTLWVEADVAGFFRSLGRGHTTRMAEVLKTFMHARLAGVVKGPETVDYSDRPTEDERLAARAQLAAMQQRLRGRSAKDWG